MEQICKNCGHVIAENFCSNCGQKKFKRIDRKYIWEEIQYTFLHTNKGFLYSVKNIAKNPGKTAREFIDGNRINHYKPILLAFVLSGISAFVSYKILGLKEMINAYYSEKHMNSPLMNDYLSFTQSYNAILMLSLIPIFALTTKFAFKKWGHNYYEHVIMNAYILIFYTLMNLVLLYPILYLFKGNAGQFISVTGWMMLFTPFLLFWFFKEFYKEKPIKSIIGRVLLTCLYTAICFFIIMIIVVIGGVIYGVMKGPEGME